MLTRRVGERAAMAGMVCGMLAMLVVKTSTGIAWTWYVMIGTAITFGAGYVASFVLRDAARPS
jgi:solute:Na+ symporter, SSS family